MGRWWMREAHTCLWHNWSGFPSWNLLLPLQPGSCPLCEGCGRLWLWFSSSSQICSWFMAGKSHAQLSYYLIRDRFPSLLRCHSLSHLSHCLAFNSNSTQHSNSLSPNMSPYHLFSWHVTRLSSFLPSLNIFFYSALFFPIITLWTSSLILFAWHQ